MAFDNFQGDPSELELYARYAYHLIAKDFRAHKDRYEEPSRGIYYLRLRLKPIDDMMLDTFLAAYSFYVARGLELKLARTAMIERARKGMDFRSVVFVDYKAHRRLPPRVTNRGGQANAMEDS